MKGQRGMLHFRLSVRQFVSSSVSFSFVSSSVHRFIFVRQFVSLSVRQFHFHSSVRQVDLLSACRCVLLAAGGAMLSALQNIFFLAAELCVLLIVPAYAKK